MTGAARLRALDYLRGHHVMTLATHGSAGPWAAAVFYVNDGFTLYFLSAPATRHARDMAANPRVAATIQEDYDDWTRIRGVQLEGEACQLAGEEAEQARRLYGEKYPIVAGPSPAAIATALAKVRWYRVTPAQLYFVDNSAGFGHRDRIIPAAPD
jgi:uncharacterized protein YhbP (UPF0306 family)